MISPTKIRDITQNTVFAHGWVLREEMIGRFLEHLREIRANPFLREIKEKFGFV
jgi:hypothetical protein